MESGIKYVLVILLLILFSLFIVVELDSSNRSIDKSETISYTPCTIGDKEFTVSIDIKSYG